MASGEPGHKDNRVLGLEPWLVWLLGAAFFFLEYVIRLSPSIMVKELMLDFNTTALGLGVLSVGFHYTYLGMQLPVGVMVDRYGAHKLLVLMTLISAAGSVLFAFSTNIYIAQLARLLLGFSTAFAFVGTLKLCSNWFPMHRFTLLAGLTQAMGMLGASMGEGPMSYVVSSIGWRQYVLLIALAFLFLSLLMLLFPRNRSHPPYKAQRQENPNILDSLKSVCRNPLSWIMMAYAGFIYAPTAAFAELWGATYFETVFNMDKHVAAECVSLIFLGWFIGAPSIGFFSELLNGHRKYIMIFSAASGLLIFSALLVLPNLSDTSVMVLAFLYGFTNTGLILAYAAAGYVNETRFTGTALAFANVASVIIGALLQPVMGWLIDLQWSGNFDAAGNRLFTAENLRMSMSMIPICFILALVTSIFLVKERHLHRDS